MSFCTYGQEGKIITTRTFILGKEMNYIFYLLVMTHLQGIVNSILLHGLGMIILVG